MRSFFAFIFLLVFLCSAGRVSAVTQEIIHKFDELSLVWTASYGVEGEQVYSSTFSNKEWSVPVQVSDASELVFHSAATIADDGRILVVWGQFEKTKRLLYFSTCRNGQWSKPKRISTGMDDNRDATVAIDDKGVVLIAWTGAAENSYSDIFWSKFVNDSWTSAHKVHPSNNVPDIDPALWIAKNGDVTLSWQTFVDGNPVTASLQWDGKSWIENNKGGGENYSTIQKIRLESLPKAPKFIQERYKAQFFFKDKYGRGSLSLMQYNDR